METVNKDLLNKIELAFCKMQITRRHVAVTIATLRVDEQCSIVPRHEKNPTQNINADKHTEVHSDAAKHPGFKLTK